MALRRYQITWNMPFDARCDVSLMLDPGMVALAIKGGGVKETPSRLELCKLVREMAVTTHPQLRMEPIWFESLTIQPLFSSPRPD